MRAADLLYINLNKATDYAIELFREELREQGHKSSGRLEESFAKVISIKVNDVASGKITAEEYADYLDRGIKAENVKYNPEVLLPWIKRIKPGLSIKEQTSFAWAIRKTHEKTGIPSRGSFAFTKNGSRTSFIKRALSGQEDKIAEIIDLAAYLSLLTRETIGEISPIKNAA